MPVFNLINALPNIINIFAKEISWCATGHLTINRRRRALVHASLRLHHAAKDIISLTGHRTIDTSLAGERDAKQLARLREQRCKESQEVIAADAQRNDQDDHLIEDKIAVDLCDSHTAKIKEGELAGRAVLTQHAGDQFSAPAEQSRRLDEKRTWIVLQSHGIGSVRFVQDTAQFANSDPTTVLTLISEYGLDMSHWPSEKHFVS